MRQRERGGRVDALRLIKAAWGARDKGCDREERKPLGFLETTLPETTKRHLVKTPRDEQSTYWLSAGGICGFVRTFFFKLQKRGCIRTDFQ